LIILQILIIALLFTLVVGAHELGHYWFARWRGMTVEEFAIGFGPKVMSRKDRHGTEFSLRALPLGGFVRIKGMEPKADGSEVTVANGFYAKGLGSRALVLFAGPLFSFLFGWILFFGNAAGFGWNNAPYIGEVLNGSPAEQAGLQKGDRLVSINGEPIRAFTELGETVQEVKGAPMSLVVQRNGAEQTIPLSAEFTAPTLSPEILNSEEYKSDPELRKELNEKRWLVGVGQPDAVPVGVIGAAGIASEQTWMVISETVKVFRSPGRLAKEAGGVISIGKAAGEAVERGLSYFLMLSGLISVSLGLINLIPIPLLDGGQLLVVFLEWLRGGRRLSIKTQEALGFVGILIIAALFLTVTFLDIGRLTSG
jgi:regulator of sigma E protease